MAKKGERIAPGTLAGRRTAVEPRFADEEWNSLATALNSWGVKHVGPSRASPAGVPRLSRDLFERLARASDARLQQAAILLLLTHPELASDAQAAADSLEGVLRDRAMRRYVAAAALQRMARTRIALALGIQPTIPPAFLDELHLPPLECEFGRESLLALAAEEESRYGHAAWRGYMTLLDSFLAEIRRSGWGISCASEPTVPG